MRIAFFSLAIVATALAASAASVSFVFLMGKCGPPKHDLLVLYWTHRFFLIGALGGTACAILVVLAYLLRSRVASILVATAALGSVISTYDDVLFAEPTCMTHITYWIYLGAQVLTLAAVAGTLVRPLWRD